MIIRTLETNHQSFHAPNPQFAHKYTTANDNSIIKALRQIIISYKKKFRQLRPGFKENFSMNTFFLYPVFLCSLFGLASDVPHKPHGQEGTPVKVVHINQPSTITTSTTAATINLATVLPLVQIQSVTSNYPQVPSVSYQPQVWAFSNQPDNIVFRQKEIVFRQEFKSLVEEAIRRKLHAVFPSRPGTLSKLTGLDNDLYNIYLEFTGQRRWFSTLRRICMDYGIDITGLEVSDVIPACLRHILKAEGVDMDKLYLGRLTKDWRYNNANISRVYSEIVGNAIEIGLDNILPSLSYLILGYYTEYQKLRDSVERISTNQSSEEDMKNNASTFTNTLPQGKTPEAKKRHVGANSSINTDQVTSIPSPQVPIFVFPDPNNSQTTFKSPSYDTFNRVENVQQIPYIPPMPVLPQQPVYGPPTPVNIWNPQQQNPTLSHPLPSNNTNSSTNNVMENWKSSLSGMVENDIKFKFSDDFKELVRDAFNSDLPKLFCTENRIEKVHKNSIVQYIHEKYVNFASKQWSRTLVCSCNGESIFREQPFTTAEQAITIGLSRVLQAEGSDFNELFPGKKLSYAWACTAKNMSALYSKILNKPLKIKKENIVPSITYLFVGYHEKFGGDVLNKENPKRMPVEAVNSNSYKTNIISYNQSSSAISTTTSNPSRIVSVLPPSVNQLSEIKNLEARKVSKYFHPEFKELVQEAINRKLHNDFALAPNFPNELTEMEKYIYRVFSSFKPSNSQWTFTLLNTCPIVTNKFKVMDIIPAALRSILNDQGVNMDDFGGFNFEWLKSNTNVNTVFSEILGESVRVELENILPSLTYLFLTYYEKFLKKSDDNAKEKSAEEEIQNKESTKTNSISPKRKSPNVGIDVERPNKRQKHDVSRMGPVPSNLIVLDDDQEEEGAFERPKQQDEYSFDQAPTNSITFTGYFQCPNIVIPMATYPPSNNQYYGPPFLTYPTSSNNPTTYNRESYSSAPMQAVPKQRDYGLLPNSQQINFTLSPYSDPYSAFTPSNYDHPQDQQ